VNNKHLNGIYNFIQNKNRNISFFCRILEARERLYELIAHCIPAEVIFKVNFCFELTSIKNFLLGFT